MKKNFYDTSYITTMMLLLRRTLVRFVRCSAIFSQRSQRSSDHNEYNNTSAPLRLCVKLFFLLCVSVSLWQTSFSQTWIWYPGDYEIWLANKMENRRTDRGTFFPVFWKVD